MNGSDSAPPHASGGERPDNGAPDRPPGSWLGGLPSWAPWVAIGVAAVAVAIVVTVVLSGGRAGPPAAGGHSSGSPAPGSAGAPGAEAPFAFPPPKVVPLRVNRKIHVPDLSGATSAITRSLTTLYAQGLVAHRYWISGPPPSVWDAFATSIRGRAKADQKAFTIGSSGRLLTSLDVSSSSLTIRFLIDDHGRIVGAQALVAIRGGGTIRGSGAVTLAVTGEFILQRLGGVWQITGYPAASVTVRSPNASPSPPATPGPSGSTP